MTRISIIVAVAEENVIGKNNQLLWHLPADLRHFKELTTNQVVIMGRKTFESIGKLLPNRISIIISRNKNFFVNGAIIVDSVEKSLSEALNFQGREIFIIGGAEIYSQTLHLANKIYLTKVNANFDGDSFFPKIENSEWKIIERVDYQADEKNIFSYSFIIYEKI